MSAGRTAPCYAALFFSLKSRGVALGLLAHGVFSFLKARYRRVGEDDSLPATVRGTNSSASPIPYTVMLTPKGVADYLLSEKTQ